MTEGRRTLALALLPLAFLLLMSILPLLRLLQEGQGQFSVGLLADSYLQWRIVWSLLQAAASCVAALLVGLPLAWCLARYQFPGRSLTLRLLMLPFVMPTLVAGMGVLALFGPQGLLGINLQDTPWLLLYGNLFFNLPLVIRAACEGLSQIPASRIAAARTLGATPWRVFWRVEWPAVRPWLWSALCLVFLYCFSGFGLALLLGGQRYATVEVEIYQLVAYELNLADAGALAMLMLLVTGAMATLYAWLERRLAAPLKVDPLPPRAPQGRTMAATAGGAGGAAAVWRFAAAGVLWKAAQALWLLGPDLLRDEDVRLALFNSARFSALAVLLAAGLGCLHALAARTSLAARHGLSAFHRVAGMPGVWPVAALSAMDASLALLLATYALLAYPFVARSLAGALDSLPPHGRRRRAVWAHAAAHLYPCEWPLLQPAFAVVWPLPPPPRWASLPSRCFCRGRSG
jgi:thiamine transport system permease protein